MTAHLVSRLARAGTRCKRPAPPPASGRRALCLSSVRAPPPAGTWEEILLNDLLIGMMLRVYKYSIFPVSADPWSAWFRCTGHCALGADSSLQIDFMRVRRTPGGRRTTSGHHQPCRAAVQCIRRSPARPSASSPPPSSPLRRSSAFASRYHMVLRSTMCSVCTHGARRSWAWAWRSRGRSSQRRRRRRRSTRWMATGARGGSRGWW